jgi:hypothetical protein
LGWHKREELLRFAVEGDLAKPALHFEPMHWEPKNLIRAIEAAGVSLWSWNVDSDALPAHIHPADRDRGRAAFNATRAIVGLFEIDFRIMVWYTLRWISARGQGDDEGMVQRIMFGIFST